jgi:hypothetical protein
MWYWMKRYEPHDFKRGSLGIGMRAKPISIENDMTVKGTGWYSLS